MCLSAMMTTCMCMCMCMYVCVCMYFMHVYELRQYDIILVVLTVFYSFFTVIFLPDITAIVNLLSLNQLQ